MFGADLLRTNFPDASPVSPTNGGAETPVNCQSLSLTPTPFWIPNIRSAGRLTALLTNALPLAFPTNSATRAFVVPGVNSVKVCASALVASTNVLKWQESILKTVSRFDFSKDRKRKGGNGTFEGNVIIKGQSKCGCHV